MGIPSDQVLWATAPGFGGEPFCFRLPWPARRASGRGAKKSYYFQRNNRTEKSAVPPKFIHIKNALSHVPSYMFRKITGGIRRPYADAASVPCAVRRPCRGLCPLGTQTKQNPANRFQFALTSPFAYADTATVPPTRDSLGIPMQRLLLLFIGSWYGYIIAAAKRNVKKKFR
jgi:hypothetical protein